MNIYPLKFNPILKEKVWGGQKLKHKLGKVTKSNHTGESWEISGVKGNVSSVSNGVYKGKSLQELLEHYKHDFVGMHTYKRFGNEFPLLIKYLDAQTNLSVQVHPDDKMAKHYHDSFGKTEMWYIMDADKDSEIVLGMNETYQFQPDVLHHVNADNVASVFNKRPVAKGESYFIPAGKVHAIGAGVLAAEIQQTSDVTYRVYDWDRIDANGNTRELHTDLAVKAIKPSENLINSSFNLEANDKANLVASEFFVTNIVAVSEVKIMNYCALDSFVIYMCVEGAVEIQVRDQVSEVLKIGETALIPAQAKEVILKGGGSKVLEVYLDHN